MNKNLEAMKIFVKTIFDHTYKGTCSSIESLLRDGPTGKKKSSEELGLQQWFATLDDKGKENVLRIVRKTSLSAVFGFLVVLDNKPARQLLENEVSDIAVYLQLYQDQSNRFNYQPKEAIRVNLSYTGGGDLHDEFTNMIQDEL